MNPTRILFTLILCVSFFMSDAQDVTFEFETGKTKEDLKGKEANWASHVNVDKLNVRAAISFRDRDSAWYFLADSDFHVQSKYVIPGGAIANNYYDGSHEVVLQKQSGNVFTNFLHKEKESIIYVEEENFDSGTSVFKPFLDFDRKEKFITAFEMDSHAYFVTLVKGTNKIRVYTDNETVPKEIPLVLPAPVADIDLESTLKNVKVIKADKEADLFTAKSKTKLYTFSKGKLFITIDNIYKYTVLFSLDLNEYTASSHLFMQTLFYCNSVDRVDIIQTNSFVYRNKLIQGIFCPEHFWLEVKSIDKDSALFSFHAQRDSAISFASSDLIKREQNDIVRVSLFAPKKDPRSVNEKELKAKDFFKAVGRSELSFVIVNAGDNVVLKIGESHNLYTGGGGGFYGGGVGAGGVGGVPAAPVYYGGYSSKSGKSETYFKAVVNNLDSSASPAIDVDTKSDKIDNFEVDLKDNKAAAVAFDFNNKIYYFYWNKSEGKFLITRLDGE